MNGHVETPPIVREIFRNFSTLAECEEYARPSYPTENAPTRGTNPQQQRKQYGNSGRSESFVECCYAQVETGRDDKCDIETG